MKKHFETLPLPLLWAFLFSALFSPAQAQKFRYSIPGLDSVETFVVGGGSSATLRNGQGELLFSNVLTSYWLAIHESDRNSPIRDRFRQTQFTTDLYGFYGVSQSGKWDIGIHLKYGRTRLDNAARSSMLKVFESTAGTALEGADPNLPVFDRSFSGLVSAGIRFRARPLNAAPELLVSGGYALSTIKDPVQQRQLNAERDMADIGATYYRQLSSNIFYFFGASASALFRSAVRDEHLYNSNFSFFIIHRTPNRKFLFYPGLSYGLSFKPARFDSSPLVKTIDYLLAYGGAQYAPNNKYNIFLSGGFPLSIDVKQPQLEIIRNTYSVLALGARAAF